MRLDKEVVQSIVVIIICGVVVFSLRFLLFITMLYGALDASIKLF